MEDPVDLFHQVGNRLGATQLRIEHHMVLEVLNGTQHLGAFHAPLLVGARHHIELFGAGETLVDHLGGDVVVMIQIEDR